MYEFSISIIFDGLIHLVAVLFACAIFTFLLPFISNNKFETPRLRSFLLVLGVVAIRLLLIKLQFLSSLLVVAVILVVLAFALMIALFRPPLPLGALAAVIMVPVVIGMESVAVNISAMLVKGPTLLEYTGMVPKDSDEGAMGDSSVLDRSAELKAKDLTKLLGLTQKDQMAAMREDFKLNMLLFEEQGSWIHSLSFVERLDYCEEVSAVLVKKDIANGEHSLDAMKRIKPSQLVALIPLFSTITSNGDKKVAIPESVQQIAAHLGGFILDEQNLSLLKGVVKLHEKGFVEEATAYARLKVEQSQGENALASALLLAVIQAGSDLPFDQLLLDEENDYFIDIDALRSHSEDYWERVNRAKAALEKESEEEIALEIVDEQEPEEKVEPYIQISIDLGIVLVPNEEAVMHEWVAAAQNLQVRGFVSLGDQLVILNQANVMLRKGEVLDAETAGYTYHFRIEDIMNGKVTLRAETRKYLDSSKAGE